MRNPLSAHPVWRQMLIVSVGLPVVLALAIMAFAWPAARIAPRDVPVGVVGEASASQQLASKLSTTQPGAFELRLYPSTAAAESAIKKREIYGAFVMTPGQLRVFEASAAGPTVAQLLTAVGTKLAAAADQTARVNGASPITMTSTDIAPLAARDSKGVVFSSSLLPLTICSIIVAAAVGLVVRFRPAWRQLLALLLLAAVSSGGIYLVVQGWLGALPHHGGAVWASLGLTILALSAGTTGLIALFGAAGVATAAVLFVFIGNPFSGATSAPEMLPGAVNHLGQWLPPGAGANLLRSAAYFDGNAAGGHCAVLVAWCVFGFAAIVVGHHAPIRFAAARSADAAEATHELTSFQGTREPFRRALRRRSHERRDAEVEPLAPEDGLGPEATGAATAPDPAPAVERDFSATRGDR